MRFGPVAPTKDSFDNDWYIAQGFGAVTTYGRHEGLDLNLKTGGDTDLGQSLYAIANGDVVYYHYGSHPTTGFGRHLVIKINGPWGVRWCMYAHAGENAFLNSSQAVTEGQKVAELGKSGNSPSAHLHFSIWKVDPATNGGIDSIAHNDTELNAKWENPVTFLETWTQAPVPAPTPPVSDQSKYDFGDGFGIMELQAARSVMQAQRVDLSNKNNEINALKARIQNAKVALG
jgi:murein DD-endopeptidase MepM/ murein hydrolase activator NlpD